jgi:hypothetical protein
MALGQVVENGDLVAGVDQLLRTNAADVPGAAGNEDMHGATIEGPASAASHAGNSNALNKTRLKTVILSEARLVLAQSKDL